MHTYRSPAQAARQAKETAKRERRKEAAHAVAAAATIAAIAIAGAWIDGAEYRQEAQNQNPTQSQQR